MKKLNVEAMQNINAGGSDVANFILGACAGLTVAGIFGLIALPEPAVSKTIAGVCVVTGAGRYFDWW